MAKTPPPADIDDQPKDPGLSADEFTARAKAYVLEPIASAMARMPDAGTASYSDLKGMMRVVQETFNRLAAGPDAVPAAVEPRTEDPIADAQASLQSGSSTPAFPSAD